MEIRQAIPEDVAAVRACAEQAYGMYVKRMGRKPAPMAADFAAQVSEEKIDVVAENGYVRGFIVHYPNGDHVHIENVAVAPAAQGTGIGRQLIAHAEQRARDAGYDRVELYTNAKMTENLQFYSRLGYRKTGERREDGFHRVYFAKNLAGDQRS